MNNSVQSISTLYQQTLKLFRLEETDAQWHTHLFYALSLILPFVIGIYLQQMQSAIMVFVGIITIFFKSMKAPLSEKLRQIFFSGILLSLFFSLGVQLGPYQNGLFIIIPPLIWLIYKLTSWLRVSAPAQFFLFSIFMVGAYSRIEVTNQPLILATMGFMMAGTLFAMVASSLYHYFARPKVLEKTSLAPTSLQHILALAIIIPLALFVGNDIAETRPYWAPVSAFAVLEGIEFSHISKRMLHRLIGTFIGLLISPAILDLMTAPLMAIIIFSLAVFSLIFFLFRNYMLTMIVATPLTLIICSVSKTAVGPLSDAIVWERLLSVMAGSLIGWAGAYLSRIIYR
ncbi:FUSC family protein [Persicobacter diffluens]|uniref:Integral membrane bound transporter domain-containing protein n=1 Tax=Persicobacter diffluens TaxID=981 RepID=A0AAN4W063_9BACT|nr:hypothetical protein PEDI_38130 [Persicobacter diffluens]